MKKTIYISVGVIILVVLGLVVYTQSTKVDEIKENPSVVKLQDETKSNLVIPSTKPQNEAKDKKVGGGSQLVLEGEADTSAIDADISTWTTYTNDSCNFTIKFPSSYVVLSDMQTCSEEVDYDTETRNVVSIANQAGCLVTQLGQQPAVGCEMHEIYVWNNTENGTGPTITHSTRLVDGIQSKQMTIVGEGHPAGQIVIGIPYNELWYTYRYSFGADNLDVAESTLERILSTIEFN